MTFEKKKVLKEKSEGNFFNLDWWNMYFKVSKDYVH